ncbi:Hypothetical protein UVM_LOCUS473 [uncultured virus]|nr:Hypothetical protein UVM_LOCUS473 [uncultured virus]
MLSCEEHAATLLHHRRRPKRTFWIDTPPIDKPLGERIHWVGIRGVSELMAKVLIAVHTRRPDECLSVQQS